MPGSAHPGRIWRLAVALLAVAVGINLGTPTIAAALLRGALSRSLRAGGAVEASVEAWPPPAPWWGHADVLNVAGRDLQFGDLQVETFTSTLDRVWFDPLALYLRQALVIRSVGFGVAHATVSQEALARAIALPPNARVDSVLLRHGRVTLRGGVRVLGAQVPVEAEGRLVLRDASTVDVVLDRVTVAGGTLQGQLTRFVKSGIAVPPLPFGLHLTAVIVGDGRLVLDAATGSP